MAVCVVASCVQGCGCSWICGGEKSSRILIAGEEEQFVSERVRFCSCFTTSFQCSSPLSWPLLPMSVVCSMISSSSRASREQPPRNRNSRAVNPSRRKGSSQAAAGRMFVSDLNLVAALHEFIAAGDLPPEQVPSTQELARGGRQDLANAVRRRGFKVVAQLLANPNFLRTSGANPSTQAKPSESQGIIEPESTHQDHYVRPKVQSTCTDQFPSRHDDVNGDLSSQQMNSLNLQQGPSFFVARAKMVVGSGAGKKHPHWKYALSETSTKRAISTPNLPSSSEGRLESYSNMRTGLLDETDQAGPVESHQGLLSQPNIAQLSQVAGKLKNRSSNSYRNIHAFETSSDDDERNGLGSKPNSDFSGSQDMMAWQKAAMLKTKLQSFFSNPMDTTMLQKLGDRGANFDHMAEDESLRSPSSLQEVQDIQAAPRTDPSTELDCIRALLHAKEMENLRVTRDLEEVKALLALIRAKAAAELAQAKQQAAEKDLQLQMAQQALLSLKMVRVEWWGKGCQVELAGSFNGWGHHLCLFPDLASESLKHDGSHGPMMWAVELWLYPGIYEIKFIVDGKWQIDHQREEVQHNLGSNNLLQVDP